ncbi:MAG: DNA polymerase I [Dehalococcoidia bacterium]|nr:DNA polymerase I [Dehalococcoidia bacterium]
MKSESSTTENNTMRLVILDSHGIIFRSYFALKDGLTLKSTGESVNAVYGFATSLLTVVKDLAPTHIIAAWDASADTFRKDLDVNYKAHRDPTPPDLIPQFEHVRNLLDAFDIPLIEREGFEADDILGTFAKQAAEKSIETIIVTLDNDMIQLVDENVKVYMYRPYQREYVMYDREAVIKRWNFEPLQMIDYKSLVGDASDNIPGVKGIGEKGAKALINQWGSVENMLENLDLLEPSRLQKALVSGQSDALLSKKLATIVDDIPDLELPINEASFQNYDRTKVTDFFKKLEFNSLVNRLPVTIDSVDVPIPNAELSFGIINDINGLSDLVLKVREAEAFSFALITEDNHPIRARHSLVGISITIPESSTFYIPIQNSIQITDSHQKSFMDANENNIPQTEIESLLTVNEIINYLLPVFKDASIHKITHDVKFALLVLSKLNNDDCEFPNYIDTQIAAYLLGDFNMSLDRLVEKNLGLEITDSKTLLGSGKKAVRYQDVDINEVARYASMRSRALNELSKNLLIEVDQNHLKTVLQEIDLPHIPVLARIEQFGMALDQSVLNGLSVELRENIALLENQAYQEVGHDFKIASPQELSKVLFEELNLPLTRKTKTGYTTDANALAPMRNLHPLIDVILNWRELTKIKSTYVDSLPLQVDPVTNRVHTIFSQSTTATGRLSSNDPNLQNIPVRSELGQAVRKAFIARDCGSNPILLSIDYSQIELRVLAHVSEDDALRQAFIKGEDIHSATAASIFNIDQKNVTSEMRRRAKVFNFGVLYGLTGFGLSQREGIEIEEANAFIEAYFNAYPKVQEWRESIVDESRSRGFAETLSGRRRLINDLNSSNFNRRQAAERIAINMPIQGTAADIIKVAMNDIDKELLERRKKGMLGRMVLQVHDEIIFELPSSELDDIREIAHRLMPSLQLSVPLELDEKNGYSWGELS